MIFSSCILFSKKKNDKKNVHARASLYIVMWLLYMEPNEGLKNHGVHLMIGSLQITSFMFIFVLVLRFLYTMQRILF